MTTRTRVGSYEQSGGADNHYDPCTLTTVNPLHDDHDNYMPNDHDNYVAR
jgi:hypothetical protein